jgi:MurNAc alpha-1-phosphate uridylyltransferase
LGTRLRTVAPNTPKALVPVAGRPFVEHQFDLLRPQGFTRILMCVGVGAEAIIAHVGDGRGFGMQVSYSREDPARLLGTGGALVNALPLLDKELLVLYGDSYLPTDYGVIAASFRRIGRPALMSVYRNLGLWDKSNTRVEGDSVVFYSKAAGPGEADCIDYGLSGFRRTVIEAARALPMPLDLARIQQDLVRRGAMGACVVPDRFYEIGKPDGLAELDALLTAGKGSR